MKSINSYRKHLLLSSFLFMVLQFNLSAKVDTVLVGPNNSFTFSPASFTMNLGDTVLWQWSSGSHTTTSTSSIPAGATPWDVPMTINSTSFMYKPSVTGTYLYDCTPHSATMTGSFTVECITDTSVNLSGNTLMANSSQASYRWVSCDNNYTGNAADTNQSFTPTNSGNYALIVSNSGCVDTSSCYNITVTSIIENNLTKPIQLAPNPAKNYLELVNLSATKINTLRVYNIGGQMVLEKVGYSLNSRLDVSQMLEGVYFIEVLTENKERYLSKFVKQ